MINFTSILEQQLNMIKTDCIKKDAIHFLGLPEVRSAFLHSSSSSGMYHPEDENSSCGLLIHTLRVINLVMLICNVKGNVCDRQEEFDCAILAALLHDVPYKLKEDGKANRNHAKDNALFFSNNTTLTCDLKKAVATAILNHNGRWETACGDDFDNYHQTELGAIVHLADYIASRNNIRVEVDSIDYIKQCLGVDNEFC